MTSRRLFARLPLAVAGCLLAAARARARTDFYGVETPRVSQRAIVSQRLGITDVSIVYHRPRVNGRKIWGDLVPWGHVWRAGANEGTLFTSTDDVTVEGQPLPKGTYGLHMLPTERSWTVIFSKDATSWGSFSYDPKDDALRVTVDPEPSGMHEALTYDFDELKPGSALVTLRWERLAVPFRVAVDVPKVTVASLRRQLRSIPGFTWQGWNEAAAYCLENRTNLEEALKWADTSIQNEERFENLDVKSKLLRATGKTAEADALKTKALGIANALQLHNSARELLAEKKVAEAVAVFESNVRKHPDDWFVYLGLARGLAASGNYKEAAKNVRIAQSKSPEVNRRYLQGLIDKLDAGKDID